MDLLSFKVSRYFDGGGETIKVVSGKSIASLASPSSACCAAVIYVHRWI